MKENDQNVYDLSRLDETKHMLEWLSGIDPYKAIITTFEEILSAKIEGTKLIKFEVLAPIAFRIPISLVRCSLINMANPNKPKQATNIDIIVNAKNMILNRLSFLNCRSKMLVMYSYLKG